MLCAKATFTALIVIFQILEAPFEGVNNVFVFLFMHSISEYCACVVVLALSEIEFENGNSKSEVVMGILARSVC